MPNAARPQSLASAAFLSVGAVLCATLAVPGAAHQRPEAEQERLIEETVVYGRAERQIGAAGTASEGRIGYADIHLPPLLRVGELVESMPGMVATQHSGTGKANQYFLRGFNLDHGTDFSAHLDGVPINMRSHGHGQGYLDLNFIIPEGTYIHRETAAAPFLPPPALLPPRMIHQPSRPRQHQGPAHGLRRGVDPLDVDWVSVSVNPARRLGLSHGRAPVWLIRSRLIAPLR